MSFLFRSSDRVRTTNNLLGDCYAAAVVEHLSKRELSAFQGTANNCCVSQVFEIVLLNPQRKVATSCLAITHWVLFFNQKVLKIYFYGNTFVFKARLRVVKWSPGDVDIAGRPGVGGRRRSHRRGDAPLDPKRTAQDLNSRRRQRRRRLPLRSKVDLA